jgi:hypothetical protein
MMSLKHATVRDSPPLATPLTRNERDFHRGSRAVGESDSDGMLTSIGPIGVCDVERRLGETLCQIGRNVDLVRGQEKDIGLY